MSEIGFIILRHVNSELTNKYWIYCYDCIRKFYPENKILIIDDNSNYEYITEKKLYETRIIQSEYHGRGEFLPYYYYLHNKEFDKALIIHDSVFINKKVDLSVDNYKILWTFNHNWDNINDEKRLLNKLSDPDKQLSIFHQNKSLWKGCFGCMCIITHEYLTCIDNKYNIEKLLDCIITRSDRCSFERIIACLLQKDIINEPLFGDIHKYCRWGISFSEKDKYDLPFTKVWTGR